MVLKNQKKYPELWFLKVLNFYPEIWWFSPENWPWNLTLNVTMKFDPKCDYEIWPWNLTMKFHHEIWPPHFKTWHRPNICHKVDKRREFQKFNPSTIWLKICKNFQGKSPKIFENLKFQKKFFGNFAEIRVPWKYEIWPPWNVTWIIVFKTCNKTQVMVQSGQAARIPKVESVDNMIKNMQNLIQGNSPKF